MQHHAAFHLGLMFAKVLVKGFPEYKGLSTNKTCFHREIAKFIYDCPLLSREMF